MINEKFRILESVLKKHFTYDQIFNLIEYDSDMSRLYLELKALQKDSYDPNYRFIFTHYDTEYYISHDQPGLTLRNLQRILQALNISNYFCIVVSATQIQHHLDLLQVQETNDVHSIQNITGLVNPYYFFQTNHVVDNNVEHINKKYISLNGTDRFHRRLLYLFLYNNNLLDHGIVSYKSIDSNMTTEKQNKIQPVRCIPPELSLIYTSPFTRINDKWFINEPEINIMLQSTSLDPYKNFEDNYGRYEDPAIGLAQQAFLYVVSETTFNYPAGLVTEKITKPIVAKRPFLVVSSVECLKKIKDAGFKTFDCWWDEGYDNISNPTERLKAIVEIIRTISSKSITELKEMYQEMQEVIDYNFDYYQTNFCNDQLNKIDVACKNNLGYR